MGMLDKPVDPDGAAYCSINIDAPFEYLIITKDRRTGKQVAHMTNNRKRWKRHYKRCLKRWIPGTWLERDEIGFNWEHMILSRGAL